MNESTKILHLLRKTMKIANYENIVSMELVKVLILTFGMS